MRRPWFPLYGDDFYGSGKVKVMSNAEKGCYVALLWHQWVEGFVPSEVEELANICGEPLPKMRKYWKRLERCFPVGEDGKRRNARQAKEREKALRISYQNAMNVGKRYASRSPSGSDSVASPVTTTQVTGHRSQPTEKPIGFSPDQPKREPALLADILAERGR